MKALERRLLVQPRPDFGLDVLRLEKLVQTGLVAVTVADEVAEMPPTNRLGLDPRQSAGLFKVSEEDGRREVVQLPLGRKASAFNGVLLQLIVL